MSKVFNMNGGVAVDAAPTSGSGNAVSSGGVFAALADKLGTDATAAAATKLATARTIDGVSFDGSADITHYGVCSTASATAEKVVSITGFSLVQGAIITVHFDRANTAENPTLNISGTGAKNIYHRTYKITSGFFKASHKYNIYYNGTNYYVIGEYNARSARFVVGTSASGHTAADCDYLCDGAADQIEINNAITALPDTGGEIVLLDGTYNLTGSIKVNKANVTLRGNGASTILKRGFSGSSSVPGVVYVNADGCTIRDLTIDGVKETYSTSAYDNGIYVYISGSDIVNIAIVGNTIINNNNRGIYLHRCKESIVANNICKNNDNAILLVSATTGVYASDNLIVNNVANDNVTSGIQLQNCRNNVVAGNILRRNGTYGIYLSSSAVYNTIVGNDCAVLSDDTTVSTYSIYLNGTTNNYNLIADNHLGIVNYVSGGGTDNTFVNNKYIDTTGCFTAGTAVLTSLDGDTVPIEQLSVGDTVVSLNTSTNENYLAKIKRVIVNRNSRSMAKVELADGTVLEMTDCHPIYTQDGFHSITRYKGYNKLVVGDIAKTADGWSEIVGITQYTRSVPVTTYTLDVIDFDESIDNESEDNFYANGVVAHNKSGDL